MNEIAQQQFRTFAAMTLVAIVLYYQADWRFMVPLYSMAAAGFTLKPKWTLHHWVFWSLVTAILLAHLVITWPQEGNNYYLYFYAALTVLVGCLTDSLTVVKQNARLLIGFVFTFAAGWKVASGSYLNGEFFRHTLLVEPRTSQLAKWFFPEWFLPNAVSTATFEAIVHALTWSGLTLEVLVAVTFLLHIQVASRFRNLLLLGFMLCAYVLLPVPAFGMTLASLGYVQAGKLGRVAYSLFFIAMPLTTLRTF